VVERIYWVQIEKGGEEIEELEEEQRSRKMVFNLAGDEGQHNEPAKSQKVAGRNDPCPCGSGKKYKKCCGK
jgi:preprotein translocase subunit SecA